MPFWISGACYYHQPRRQTSYSHSLNGSYSRVISTESRNEVVCRTARVCTKSSNTFSAAWIVSSAIMVSPTFNATTETGVLSVICSTATLVAGIAWHRIFRQISILFTELLYLYRTQYGHIRIWLQCEEFTLPSCNRYYHIGPSPRVMLWITTGYTFRHLLFPFKILCKVSSAFVSGP